MDPLNDRFPWTSLSPLAHPLRRSPLGGSGLPETLVYKAGHQENNALGLLLCLCALCRVGYTAPSTADAHNRWLALASWRETIPGTQSSPVTPVCWDLCGDLASAWLRGLHPQTSEFRDK